MSLLLYALIMTGAFVLSVVVAAFLVGADVLQTFHEENARALRQLKRYLAMHLLRAFLLGLPLALFGCFILYGNPTPSDLVWFFSFVGIWWTILVGGLVVLAWMILNALWRGSKAP